MIARVTLWSNGMVMVFDANGEQMPEYQGPLLRVRRRILADAPSEAQFQIGAWEQGLVPMNREAFASESWSVPEEDTP